MREPLQCWGWVYAASLQFSSGEGAAPEMGTCMWALGVLCGSQGGGGASSQGSDTKFYCLAF